jgi:hypothetical protein
MKLLKRKYGKVAEAKTKAANKIAVFIGRLKTACALYLDKKINPLPLAKKRWLLFGFALLLAFYSVLLLLAPFRTKQKDVAIKVEPIQFPKQRLREEHLRPGVFISGETYKRIHSFKLYLDSLAKDAAGRRLYDSIVARHPGITDSLQQVEDYYQLQK